MATMGGRSFTISFSEYGQAFNILNSSKYTSITLHHCTKPLPASVIQLLKQTVTSLTFSSMTSFSNIRLCLQNLPRLRILSFRDVLIDNKYSLPTTSKQYETPSLKWLNFEHKLEEANNDVFLLQFFSTNVSMPNLEALSFMEDSDFDVVGSGSSANPPAIPAAPSVSRIFEEVFSSSRTSLHSSHQLASAHEEIDRDLENEANASVLARFLHENFDKLKVLRIRDHCIQVGNPRFSQSHHLSYVLLKLEELVYSMDDPGQSFILTCQKSLSTLVGCSLIYDFHVDKFDTFFYGLDRNYRTLTEIRLCPYIVLDGSTTGGDDDESEVDTKIKSILIDCKSMQKCENLSTVEIEIKVLDSRSSSLNANKAHPKVRTVGILTNVHHLPSTLQDLILAGNTLMEKELDLLFLRLPDFTFLENLSIELAGDDAEEEDEDDDEESERNTEEEENYRQINSRNVFYFRKEWLKVLAKLGTKRLNMARFGGCTAPSKELGQMQNYANFKGFIMERKKHGRALTLTFRF